MQAETLDGGRWKGRSYHRVPPDRRSSNSIRLALFRLHYVQRESVRSAVKKEEAEAYLESHRCTFDKSALDLGNRVLDLQSTGHVSHSLEGMGEDKDEREAPRLTR